MPEERTFSYQELTFYRSGALYRFPLNLLFKFAGVPLGVAQAALDALIEAGPRPARLMTIEGKAIPPRTLREKRSCRMPWAGQRRCWAARAYLRHHR